MSEKLVVTAKVGKNQDWAIGIFDADRMFSAKLCAKRLTATHENVRLRRITKTDQVDLAEFQIEKCDDWSSD